MVIAPKGIIKCAVDLVQIQIGGCCTSRLLTLSVTVDMDSLHQGFQLFWRYQTGVILRICAIRANVDHTNPIMRIQYSDGIARTDRQPLFQIASSTVEYGMQNKRRQSKIIDTIHLTSDLNLPAKIGMDFDSTSIPNVPAC